VFKPTLNSVESLGKQATKIQYKGCLVQLQQLTM